ncbi:hypothetical protein [Curtobacterium sp. MCBD17_040]|uniref:hypothetical protein n=1 Tax=Curtobacterium sp. MCBD17_040 TaxID=2175674 RepID=UPI000DA7F09B|nr:hypothetical protein [Curtobacterium sp. MCBD17_040]WIB65669.1 hypothetical protein DEI94_16240 [Curtobacterium sp. MCBD17_040]
MSDSAAETVSSPLDVLPARDVFVAEVFGALPQDPDGAAATVSAELQRKHALSALAVSWTAHGHAFDSAETPESQQERERRFGWCTRCGYVIHKGGQLTARATTECSPARIGLR